MSLSLPRAERKRMHLRRVDFQGFKRADGLWEIEARLVDTKDQDFPLSSGLRRPGEAIHDISVRIVFDGEMNVLDVEAGIDAAPYMGYCNVEVPDYSRIVGLNLFKGFPKAVRELFGGAQGCAHITELVMQLPTAALQTLSSEMAGKDYSEHPPFHLDRCHALVFNSEAVRRYYPRWYRKKDAG